MKKYRDLTPEEQWEIIDNLTPQDITNGMVDHYLNDNVFWRDVEYEHPDLLSFLDNRFAIINKEYGLEKLHHLSKHHPRKKWEQSIAWYNYENNQNTNENKNMKQNKIKITENELKQIVAESVKKILNEERTPFMDSEIAMGVHKRNAILRFNEILRDFQVKIGEWVNDEGLKGDLDRNFIIKIGSAVHRVLDEYGLKNY